MREEIKRKKIRDELIFDTMVAMVLADPTANIRPEEIAMSIYREYWQELLPRIRLFARQLAMEGYLSVIRKGKIADPNDFKGIYRLKATPQSAQYIPRLPA